MIQWLDIILILVIGSEILLMPVIIAGIVLTNIFERRKIIKELNQLRRKNNYGL